MTKIYAALAAAAVVGLIGGTAGYILMNRASDQYAACRGGAVGVGSTGSAAGTGSRPSLRDQQARTSVAVGWVPPQ